MSGCTLVKWRFSILCSCGFRVFLALTKSCFTWRHGDPSKCGHTWRLGRSRESVTRRPGELREPELSVNPLEVWLMSTSVIFLLFVIAFGFPNRGWFAKNVSCLDWLDWAETLHLQLPTSGTTVAENYKLEPGDTFNEPWQSSGLSMLQ